MKKFWTIFATALISAILLRLAFPKPALGALAFVALVPFLFALSRVKRPRDGFLFGFAFGFIFHYANIFWLNTIAAYNQFVYIGIFLVGIYLGLYVAIFGWGAVFLRRWYPRAAFILLPALWVALEYARNVGELAFPWSYLSATQPASLPLIQICEITGVWGVSFVLALINVALTEIAITIASHQNFRKCLPAILSAAVVLAATLIFGYARLGRSYNGDKSVRVVLIQPDIPQKLKFTSYAGSDIERQQLPEIIRERNFSMLQSLKPNSADLVVLPESAFTRPFFGMNKALIAKLGKEAKRLSVDILLGANREVLYNAKGEVAHPGEEIKDIGAYNSAWYFQPDGKLFPRTYDKIHLVPFGEHLPYFHLIPGFQRIIVQTGSFMEGKNYTLFPVFSADKNAPFHFATAICFESSFGWLMRRFVKRGADFLVIITNDGWYEDRAGPYQHNDLAVFRAIETRRWVVRCANRGISCVIAPTGKIIRESHLNHRAIITAQIYPKPNHTCYERFSDAFIFLIMAILLGGFILHVLRKKSARLR